MARAPSSALVRDVPRERISRRLEETRVILEGQGIPSRVFVHRYPKGHVEGQLTAQIPRGVDPNDALLAAEAAFSGKPFKGNYWISVGVLFDMAKVDGVDYRRSRGSYDIQVYFQRAVEHDIAEVFLILRQRITGRAAKTLRHKPTGFYIRLTWMPDKDRPRRKEK